jgi:putative hemolysin
MGTSTLSFLFALSVGLMTAAATSVRTVSWIWLRHWAERQIAGDIDQAAPALGRPHRYLLAAGTGIAAVVFSLGATLAFREDDWALVRAVGVATLLLLVFGQLVPRAIARRSATALIPALMPLLRALDALFGPILAFAARAVRPIVRHEQRARLPEPTDPLEDLLREAEAEGLGEAAESEIISGVVEFGEKRVGDVMTPRARVTSVSPAAEPSEVAQVVAASQYTRVPVLGPGPDDVAGIVHAFDVLLQPSEPLAHLRPCATARADEPCGVVMRRMMRERRHLAVVRDAASAVVGIVTLEDLVEELVGDIRDEHDEPGGVG